MGQDDIANGERDALGPCLVEYWGVERCLGAGERGVGLCPIPRGKVVHPRARERYDGLSVPLGGG